jgi:hypothetical protein
MPLHEHVAILDADPTHSAELSDPPRRVANGVWAATGACSADTRERAANFRSPGSSRLEIGLKFRVLDRR